VADGASKVPEPVLPDPIAAGASRSALAVLQTQAVSELRSGGIAARLYASAAVRGREHLDAAADRDRYRAAIDDGTLPGPFRVLSLGARKRWIEEVVKHAIRAGIEQVVVLGAGFDTLGLRLLAAHPDLVVIELERPVMVLAKRQALEAAGITPPWPLFVDTDLSDPGSLRPLLAAQGWRGSRPTAFVAEGILEYLPPRDALAVVAEVARLSAPGSRLACTVRSPGPDPFASPLAGAGEPIRFRPDEAALPELFAGAGFEILQRIGHADGRGGGSALVLLAPAPSGSVGHVTSTTEGGTDADAQQGRGRAASS
jgi:methyltransferase (TIGR00027 family)